MSEGVSRMNWLAISGAGIAHAVLAMIWLALWSRRHYALALDVPDRPQQRTNIMRAIVSFVCSIAAIVTAATLVRALGATTHGAACVLGLLFGFGYLAAMIANISSKPLFPKTPWYAFKSTPFSSVGGRSFCMAPTVAA
jgi:hypothetical protein